MKKSNEKKPITEAQLKRVSEAVDFAKKAIMKNADGAEAILITHHVIKDGRIVSYFDYSDFPQGDWGKAMVAIAIESRQAELRAMTGTATSKA